MLFLEARRRNGQSREDTVNIQKNQIYTVKITDMGTDGEGIGHLEETGQESKTDGAVRSGYTLFVKDAVMGDTVRARIVKAKKGYAYARLEEVLEASPDRVEPVCALSLIHIFVSFVRRSVSFKTIRRYFSCSSGGIVPSSIASR